MQTYSDSVVIVPVFFFSPTLALTSGKATEDRQFEGASRLSGCTEENIESRTEQNRKEEE